MVEFTEEIESIPFPSSPEISKESLLVEFKIEAQLSNTDDVPVSLAEVGLKTTLSSLILFSPRAAKII